MELTKRVFEAEGRWQYEICQDGVSFIKQDFKPGTEGFVPMVEDEANFFADEMLRRMQDASSE